jgi:hypothetical protein
LKFHRWPALVAALVVAGCAQSPKLSAEAIPEDSAIRLIRDLSIRQSQETAGANNVMDSVFRPLIAAPIQSLRASGAVTAGDGFYREAQSWCENPAIKRDLLQDDLALGIRIP